MWAVGQLARANMQIAPTVSRDLRSWWSGLACVDLLDCSDQWPWVGRFPWFPRAGLCRSRPWFFGTLRDWGRVCRTLPCRILMTQFFALLEFVLGCLENFTSFLNDLEFLTCSLGELFCQRKCGVFSTGKPSILISQIVISIFEGLRRAFEQMLRRPGFGCGRLVEPPQPYRLGRREDREPILHWILRWWSPRVFLRQTTKHLCGTHDKCTRRVWTGLLPLFASFGYAQDYVLELFSMSRASNL